MVKQVRNIKFLVLELSFFKQQQQQQQQQQQDPTLPMNENSERSDKTGGSKLGFAIKGSLYARLSLLLELKFSFSL